MTSDSYIFTKPSNFYTIVLKFLYHELLLVKKSKQTSPFSPRETFQVLQILAICMLPMQNCEFLSAVNLHILQRQVSEY